jgi:hypothetical protein
MNIVLKSEQPSRQTFFADDVTRLKFEARDSKTKIHILLSKDG